VTSTEYERMRRLSTLLCAFGLLVPVLAFAHMSDNWARERYAAAQRLQTQLEAQPAQKLTRKDYERVINAYKSVYLEAPASSKADPSVVAVAQLLEEMGRALGDREALRAAVKQYEFLRRQYPGSKARFAALYHIGEIYKDDLHDKAKADEVFQEFLRRYPRNQFAAEVQKALAEPAENASLKTPVKKRAQTQAAQPKEKDEDEAVVANDSSDDQPASAPGEEAKESKTIQVTGLRFWSGTDSTRIAVDLDGRVRFDAQRIDDPDRIFFDLLDTKLDRSLIGKTFDVNDGFLKRIRISQYKPGRTRVVLEVDNVSDYKAALSENPSRLVIELRNKLAKKQEDQQQTVAAVQPVHAATADSPGRTVVTTSKGVKKTVVDADDATETPVKENLPLDPPELKAAPGPAAPVTVNPPASRKVSAKRARKAAPAPQLDVREAQPTENGDRSLIRALGLKIGKIVIDPGHGGHDTGTIGPQGLEEKDLVLDVSKRLGKLLSSRLGAEVVYTRSDDTFIPLESRTAIANQEAADLFISIHANSSSDEDARGVEVYYLNFTSSSEALEVAARENAVSQKTIYELQDLVKKIALKEKIEESQEFASDVDHSLHTGLSAKNPGLRDRGVKKAPFIVLIGANMPSILAEISFLSNPTDERKLKTQDYRQRIAESLYKGVAKYVNGLSGVKVASKIEKTGSE